MESTYITRVRSNIREGCDHELTKCTAIIGKNGSGKTTAVDAISLVTTGYARSAGLGKDGRTLSVLKPEGADKLTSWAQLSDNSVVDWQVDGSKKTWRHSAGEENLPVGVFHADLVHGMLLGDKKRIRQAIIDSSGQTIALHRIIQSLPADNESAKTLVKYLLEQGVTLTVDDDDKPLGSQELGTETIAAVLKAINKKRRVVAKDITTLDKHKQGAAFPLTEEELGELTKLEAALQSEAFLPTSAQEAAERINAGTQKRNELTAELAQVPLYEETDLLSVTASIKSIGTICAVQEDVLEQIQNANVDRCNCVVCGTQNVAIDQLQAKLAEANQQLEALKNWSDLARTAIRSKQSLTNKINGIDDELKRLHEVVSQGHLTDGADRSRYETLRARKTASEAAQNALDKLPRLQAEKQTLDNLRGVLDQQLDVSVHAAVAVIEKRINKFLPKNTRARISEDGHHISVSRTKGPFLDYRALSGAQRAMVTVAFAAATIPVDAPPVRLLVIDEVWLDSQTSRALMKAIALSVGTGGGFSQAIVCLVTWSGQAPEGWTFVQLDPKKGKSVAKKNGAGVEPQDATQAQTA